MNFLWDYGSKELLVLFSERQSLNHCLSIAYLILPLAFGWSIQAPLASRLTMASDDKVYIIFSQLSVDARMEMTKKAIKSVKHIAEKARKKNSEGDEAEGVANRHLTDEDALSHLQQSYAHLETLSHSFISYLKNSDQVNWKR